MLSLRSLLYLLVHALARYFLLVPDIDWYPCVRLLFPAMPAILARPALRSRPSLLAHQYHPLESQVSMCDLVSTQHPTAVATTPFHTHIPQDAHEAS